MTDSEPCINLLKTNFRFDTSAFTGNRSVLLNSRCPIQLIAVWDFNLSIILSCGTLCNDSRKSSINIMYNGAPLEQVKQFIYLGPSFNEKGDTIKEESSHVAKRANVDLHRIWRNRELPIPLKRKLVQLMIWPIMSYSSETWIYLKSVQNTINVFERWCYKRMLRISWTEHVTNEEVFNRANTKRTLLDELLKRRVAFHGHLVRKCGITLDLMIGRLHGTRPRGRPITTRLKDLATQANISYTEAITISRDRKNWRSVGNPRMTPVECVSEYLCASGILICSTLSLGSC